MRIEKLTENKIRIVLNIEDLEVNNIDFNSVLKKKLVFMCKIQKF